jgi:hypothetical protein
MKVEVIQTDDGVFTEDDDGNPVPVPCQWFALCENVATTTRNHPILGDVPICTRCDEKVERL